MTGQRISDRYFMLQMIGYNFVSFTGQVRGRLSRQRVQVSRAKSCQINNRV
jgi:hypothetical protein